MKTRQLLASFLWAALLLPTVTFAQIDPINLGTTANDGTGDTLRAAGLKINANFAYLESISGSSGLRYKWDDATSGDPTAGYLGLNNATFASATEVRISETDDDTNNMESFIETWDDSTNTTKGSLIIQKISDPTAFAILTLGTQTDNGTYTTITATPVLAGATALVEGDDVSVNFFRAGDVGATGATGAAGTNGTNGTNGIDGLGGRKFEFNSSTSGDPGSGKLGFNTADPVSANSIRISETDLTSGSATGWLAAWGATTSGNGAVHIQEIGSPGNHIIFTVVAGSAVDHGTYRSYTVGEITTSPTNPWANNDDVLVFFQTGPSVLSKHYAEVVRAATLSIPDDTDTLITFDTVSFSSGITTSTDTTPIDITRSGRYLVTVQCGFPINTTNVQVSLYKNGSVIRRATGPILSGSTVASASYIMDLTVGDTLGMSTRHTHGSATSTSAAVTIRPTIAIHEL